LLLQIRTDGVKTVSKSFSGWPCPAAGVESHSTIHPARRSRHGPVTESSRQRRAGVNDAEYSGLAVNGEFLTWTSKPDYADSNPAIAPP
jgi:hypothetical protein